MGPRHQPRNRNQGRATPMNFFWLQRVLTFCLAAIKSFMRFLEYRVPSALEQLRRVLAIPFQKTDIPLVRHLIQAEMQAILDAPDPSTRDGIRDRAMLHLAFTGGLRVSELVGLKLSDATFRAGYVDISVMGKGRKQRALTLWKTVAGSLRAWLSIRGDVSVPELFLNARVQPHALWLQAYP